MNDVYIYTNDHLVKAYDIVSNEFWSLHTKLMGSDFKSRADQLEVIKQLADLGNAMVAITEARKAIG